MNIISCLNHCNNLQILPLILSLAPLKFIFYITAKELFLNFQLNSMLFLILKILSGFCTALKMKSKFLIFSYKIPIEIFSPWRLCMMDSFYFLLQIQISRWEQSHIRVFTHSAIPLQLVAPAPFRWPLTTPYYHHCSLPAPSGSEQWWFLTVGIWLIKYLVVEVFWNMGS